MNHKVQKEFQSSEMNLWEDEEEQHQNPFLNSTKGKLSKLQFRNEVSEARWDEDMGMGEITEKKGGIWGNTGIIRTGGKLYCFVEEILFLAEKGALLVLDGHDGRVLTLRDIHGKVAEKRNGCSWECFKAYRRLKCLGYIVGRHDVAWSLKSSSNNKEEDDGDKTTINQFKDMRISSDMEVKKKLAFDVYLPDSRFKKTCPGNPVFVLCLISGSPPSKEEVEKLEEECNGVPLKLCHVDNGLLSFFSFERVELPLLP